MLCVRLLEQKQVGVKTNEELLGVEWCHMPDKRQIRVNLSKSAIFITKINFQWFLIFTKQVALKLFC